VYKIDSFHMVCTFLAFENFAFVYVMFGLLLFVSNSCCLALSFTVLGYKNVLKYSL